MLSKIIRDLPRIVEANERHIQFKTSVTPGLSWLFTTDMGCVPSHRGGEVHIQSVSQPRFVILFV